MIRPNSILYWNFINNLPPLSEFQKQALIGIIQGDGSQNSPNKGETYRIKFEWGGKNNEYADHVFQLYKNYILLDMPQTKKRINAYGNEIVTWRFSTVSSSIFNEFASLFLDDTGKKSIKLGQKDYITPVSLAYWFMDDGGKYDYTQSFEKEEVEYLIEQLKTKFCLDCEIRSNKSKYIILIKENSYVHFINQIHPYIIPSMKSKQHNCL